MDIQWPTGLLHRSDPSRTTNERTALDEWIAYHRATLLLKCEGLSFEQLTRRAVAPSTLTLLGLVRHMTEVERGWFRIAAGQQILPWVYSTPDDEEADINQVDDADASADLLAYVDECANAQRAVSSVALDDIVTRPDDPAKRAINVRWIYLHMIEEYARHNGHADILREQIDGATGD
jgi:uncharacterized damage-inducible protein DinB